MTLELKLIYLYILSKYYKKHYKFNKAYMYILYYIYDIYKILDYFI